MSHHKIISFLINHPQYFVGLISMYYPFTWRQLLKFIDILDWDKISENRAIEWNEGILFIFHHIINWKKLSVNISLFKDRYLLETFTSQFDWCGDDGIYDDSVAANEGIHWDIETIDEYADRINFEKLSTNTNVDWSEHILDKYKDYWNFLELAHNDSIPWTINLFEKYLDESFLSYIGVNTNKALITFNFVEKYNQFMSWHYISLMSTLPWRERGLLNYWKDQIYWSGIACNEFLFANDKRFLVKHLDKWLPIGDKVFDYFSGNKTFPWNKKSIDLYKDLLPWNILCSNEGIDWNTDLIDLYSSYIKWGELKPCILKDEKGFIISETGGWEYEIGLTSNKSVSWSIELIQKYEHAIDLEILNYNTTVWDKVFKPYVDDELIDIVMRII